MVTRQDRLEDFPSGAREAGQVFDLLREDHCNTYTLPFGCCSRDEQWRNVIRRAIFGSRLTGIGRPTPFLAAPSHPRIGRLTPYTIRPHVARNRRLRTRPVLLARAPAARGRVVAPACCMDCRARMAGTGVSGLARYHSRVLGVSDRFFGGRWADRLNRESPLHH
jgi:hypothetical protein